jgi:hypothetical protein
MNKTVVCTLLVAGLAMPLSVASAAIAEPDSSCARGMTLNFCGSNNYRATRIAVAGTALASVALLTIRANEGSGQPCPPLAAATTTTPEPATIALVGTGMLAIAGLSIRRRRHANYSP